MTHIKNMLNLCSLGGIYILTLGDTNSEITIYWQESSSHVRKYSFFSSFPNLLCTPHPQYGRGKEWGHLQNNWSLLFLDYYSQCRSYWYLQVAFLLACVSLKDKRLGRTRQNAVRKAKHRSFEVKMALSLLDNKNAVSTLEETTLTGIFSCFVLKILIYNVLVI